MKPVILCLEVNFVFPEYAVHRRRRVLESIALQTKANKNTSYYVDEHGDFVGETYLILSYLIDNNIPLKSISVANAGTFFYMGSLEYHLSQKFLKAELLRLKRNIFATMYIVNTENQPLKIFLLADGIMQMRYRLSKNYY
ncbi:MAG: hypothetical protein FWE02_03720 [Defluviitaleaceae bacterium]|nr:hypothetical protein [Defluviitaleaceae bacterium]